MISDKTFKLIAAQINERLAMVNRLLERMENQDAAINNGLDSLESRVRDLQARMQRIEERMRLTGENLSRI